jgi:hypothetical protein
LTTHDSVGHISCVSSDGEILRAAANRLRLRRRSTFLDSTHPQKIDRHVLQSELFRSLEPNTTGVVFFSLSLEVIKQSWIRVLDPAGYGSIALHVAKLAIFQRPWSGRRESRVQFPFWSPETIFSGPCSNSPSWAFIEVVSRAEIETIGFKGVFH